jgi:lipopolysaccharide biosynthesis regulator YciM
MGVTLVLVLVGCGALAAGILIGRYYVPDDRLLRRTARHSKSYMRALNHLIARDHATVIEELRKVVEENIEEVEPYFALAALFRSRGEHERAIRVHQALAVREGATRKHRVRALYELGLDFRTAGMPRRSAKAMEEVLVEEPRHEGALRALCGLYEEQGRYMEAAQAWQRLAKVHGEPATPREHHLWVAAAQTAIAAGDVDSGKRLLKDARKGHAESAHFYAAAAELAAALGNPEASRTRMCQAVVAAPELTRFFVPGLVAAEKAMILDGGVHAGEEDPLEAAAQDDADAGVGMAAGDGAADQGTPESPTPTPALTPAPAPAPETKALVKPVVAVSRPKRAGTNPAAIEAEAKRRAAVTLEELEAKVASPVPVALARAELIGGYDPAAALAIHQKLGKDESELLPTRVIAARLALQAGKPDQVLAELGALTGVLAWAADGRWRCQHCGQRAEQFAWRCASCRRWSTARVDLGGEPIAPPRERRERARTDLGRPGLFGDSVTAALPMPSLEHGLAEEDLVKSRTRASLLGRVGGWISGAWSGVRGKGRSAD